MVQGFSEILGNFQHNPERAAHTLEVVEAMTTYYHARIREQERDPRDGVVHALMTAEIDGDRLSEDEVIANCIITMTGGQETTTNLIGNGLLSLLRNPEELARLQASPSLMTSAIEEFLRYESPIQHTGRLAPADTELGGKLIRKRHAVISVIGAANRDPERFPDPDRLDITRTDNRHLAFGWAGHYCFGAPLARVEGQIAFSTILRFEIWLSSLVRYSGGTTWDFEAWKPCQSGSIRCEESDRGSASQSLRSPNPRGATCGYSHYPWGLT
jgi:pimeloyl-[acyl-carrier protein] synthase